MPASRRRKAKSSGNRPAAPQQRAADVTTSRLSPRKIGIVVACAAYLAVNGYFMLRHMVGDSNSAKAAYFFTWDMFPGYFTESTRTIIVGVTEDGRHVQLVPAAGDRYSAGLNDSVSRIDWMLRESDVRPVLDRALRRYNAENPETPIRRVLVVQQFWPIKFNLPDDLYRTEYGVDNPRRKYWRVIGRWSVADDGELIVSKGSSP